MSTMIEDPRLLKAEPGLGGFLRDLGRRVGQGDIGALPVIIEVIGKAGSFTTGKANYQGSLALTAAPVPEPETYALMLAGLGAVGFAARRRKAH